MESIAIKDLSIQVKRSTRRRSVELTVERDGRIILYAPEGAGQNGLESLVREKLLWIYQQLGRKGEELHKLPEKEFVSVKVFTIAGGSIG